MQQLKLEIFDIVKNDCDRKTPIFLAFETKFRDKIFKLPSEATFSN